MANKTLPDKRIAYRLNLINTLENHLIRNDVHIIKFFLHISAEEQKEKIENRLKIPRKRWKYDKSDIQVNNRWDEYVDMWNSVLQKSNDVPWNIIPVDKRWYRNYKVAKILVKAFEDMNLRYPSIPG
jgi:polyphosphate kinase 2 (PPK2 family)